MNLDQIVANLNMLTAEALELRQNMDQIERAETLLETAKKMVAYASELLELADLIGDDKSFVRYSKMYCRAEMHMVRAKLALFRATSKPHSWGRYMDVCIRIAQLRQTAARIPQPAPHTVPMFQTVAAEC